MSTRTTSIAAVLKGITQTHYDPDMAMFTDDADNRGRHTLGKYMEKHTIADGQHHEVESKRNSALYGILRRSGILGLWHFLNRKKISIIYMHSVLPETLQHWRPCRTTMPALVLAKQLEFLENRYTFLSLSEAIDILEGKSPPVANGLVVTLDDGYENAVEVAGKVFAEYKIRPTIYIVGDQLKEPTPFWFDRLDYAIQRAAKESATVGFAAQDFELSADMSLRQLRAVCKAIVQLSHQFDDADERHQQILILIEHLESLSGSSVSELMGKDVCVNMLTCSQLNEAAPVADFGSHTLSHRKLTHIPEAEAALEIEESKRDLEQTLGKECDTLSYPEGFFNEYVESCARTAGYRAALSTQEGLNGVGCNLFTLKRIHLSPDFDDTLLWSNVSGINAFWARVKQRLR